MNIHTFGKNIHIVCKNSDIKLKNFSGLQNFQKHVSHFPGKSKSQLKMKTHKIMYILLVYSIKVQ